ncbi:MAG TPA: helix-turn-helix domain-containing protein [Candidatus Wallbacteria bacterium]|nr:helix-turn-helix domain-containing protein [Candidatus Wallbacteria bacterium]HPG58405.1 helix-turn-helix domain-containing protein [Candidatus Wallbacteria bacterium]
MIIQNVPFSEFKLNKRGYVRPERCFILGQTKRAILANYYSGCRYFVKFKPWGAHYFLSAPMNIFAERAVGLEKALGSYGEKMGELVLKAMDKDNAAVILQDILEKRIAYNIASKKIDDDENIIETVKKIIESKNLTRVVEILETSYYGKRHLNRKFNTIIGLNPKTFIKIVRLHKCLEKIRLGKVVQQEILLKEFGYYDRSHMMREFKDTLRLTPNSYLEEMYKLSAKVIFK